MSSRESPSPSVSDGGNKRVPSESGENVGKANFRIALSELNSRYDALDREFDRFDDLSKELSSAEHALLKLLKEGGIIFTVQEELYKMLTTISDKELIKQFRKILELLGKSDNGMTFLFPEEARYKLIHELGLVMKETKEYYEEERIKQYENYEKLHHEFKTVSERLVKEGEILAELKKSLLQEYDDEDVDDEDDDDSDC